MQKTNHHLPNIFTVVRSSNERTTQAALSLAQAFATPARTCMIRQAPFEEALRETCRIGANSDTEWLAVIDADLLISVPAMKVVSHRLGTLPATVFQTQGYILDHLTGGVRPAGPRFYRCSALQHALTLVPPDGTTMRPETEMILSMNREGFASHTLPEVLAIHDYHQFYADIYRKCYTHGIKFAGLAHELFKRWQTRLDKPDFRIAMLAMADGLTSQCSVKTDARSFPSADHALQHLGFKEKPPLTPSPAEILKEVENIIREEQAVTDHNEITRLSNLTPYRRAINKCQSIGWFRMAPWLVAHCMQSIASKLKAVSTADIRKL